MNLPVSTVRFTLRQLHQIRIIGLILFTSATTAIIHYFLFDATLERLAVSLIIFLAATIGLAHGAYDMYIGLGKASPGNRRLLTKIGFYLCIVLAFAVFFYLLPGISLIVFFVLSALHFGDQHFVFKKNVARIVRAGLALIYGGAVLSLWYITNVEALSNVIIGNYTMYIDRHLAEVGSICLVFTLMLFFVWTYFKHMLSAGDIILNLLSLASLFLFFNASDVFLGFAFYFVFWHSLPSVCDQIVVEFSTLKLQHVGIFIRRAFPYWASAIITIVILILLKVSGFILLMCLTSLVVPHVLVMLNMTFRGRKELSS